MKKLQAFGAEMVKGEHVIYNDAGEIRVETKSDGHVLAVPQIGKGKVPRSILRSIIGAHDADAAREKAREQLTGYTSGEITPFLGQEGRHKEYHFDEETVRHNPLVRFYNGRHYAVLMHYGDAFRIIQGAHPAQANLIEFFPAEAHEEGGEKLLFTSPFRLKAFLANLKAHKRRTKSRDEIEVTEDQMAQLRKGEKGLTVGNYVLRHEKKMLHVYRKAE